MSNHSQPQEPAKSSQRALRKTLDTVLPLVGTLLILGVSVVRQDLPGFVWIALGLLCIEIALLKVIHRMVPEQRKYNALRAQTNQFLALVRQLNNAALRVKEYDTFENREVIDDIRTKMLRKIDQIVAASGKTDGELNIVPLHNQRNTLLKAVS